MLLWWIHHHSHKCLYQLSSTCEQKLIIKKTTYLQKKSMWNQNGHLYDQSLIWCTQQARTQALPFLGKMYAFLVSPRQKPSWRRLNTLGQKQYLISGGGRSKIVYFKFRYRNLMFHNVPAQFQGSSYCNRVHLNFQAFVIIIIIIIIIILLLL